MCGHVCGHGSVDVCVDICVDMCVDRRVDMCVGMRVGTCVDIETCVHVQQFLSENPCGDTGGDAEGDTGGDAGDHWPRLYYRVQVRLRSDERHVLERHPVTQFHHWPLLMIFVSGPGPRPSTINTFVSFRDGHTFWDFIPRSLGRCPTLLCGYGDPLFVDLSGPFIQTK